MSRKDYERIAAAIRKARADIVSKEPSEHVRDLLDGSAYTAEHIADLAASDNPRFKRALFLQACGVQE